MSTFFIYPLDGSHGKEETASLGSNGLSRILEIPLSLLDADTNELFNNKNATDQLFWLSTNNTAPTPTLPSCETNAAAAATTAATGTATTGTTTIDVTHSFANRKRSIVKRRKSVLSASFTAQDEAEAIKSDREATLAALERGTPMQHSSADDSIKDNIMIEEIAVAPVNRGNTDTRTTTTATSATTNPKRGVDLVENTNTIYILQQDESEAESRKEDEEQTVTAKDSAIDLRATALEQDKSAFTEEDAPMKEPISSSFPPSPTLTPVPMVTTTTTLPSTVATSAITTPPIATPAIATPPMATPATKKKVSAWSPRRIFGKNKDPNKQQDKFHLSSLFSRGSPKTKNHHHNNSAKSVLLHNHPQPPPPQQEQQANENSKGEFQLKSHFNYTRLPIHTERAIYRLSHMKLTNPRRPLCDQVTISNLMFWYLSIISQQNNESTMTTTETDVPVPMDSIVLTKKSCHIQIQPPRRQSKKRTSHKRIRNHQIGPTNHGGGDGNAMDTLQKQRHLYRNTQLRTSNSSSDEDEDPFSEEEEEEISDEEDLFTHKHNKTKKKTNGGKKYSLFHSSSSSQKNTNSWLSTFSPKQHTVASSTRQDEDDIPLAMYQKGKA